MTSPRATLVAVLVLAALVAGCGPDGAAVDTAAPGRTVEGCEPEGRPPLQAGAHLIGDADPPVPYSSVPPTSGWHASGALRPGVSDEPLTDPEIVALLEAGQVVAVYDPGAVDEDAVGRLEELATGAHAGRLSVTPANTAVPARLSLVAWGVLQHCDAVSAEAVTTFVLAHYGQTEADH